MDKTLGAEKVLRPKQMYARARYGWSAASETSTRRGWALRSWLRIHECVWDVGLHATFLRPRT